jgi:hypothetical protein
MAAAAAIMAVVVTVAMAATAAAAASVFSLAAAAAAAAAVATLEAIGAGLTACGPGALTTTATSRGLSQFAGIASPKARRPTHRRRPETFLSG